MLNMSYALSGGGLVHISDAERGLKCGCVCPACGARLVAKKGGVREHHFAHAEGEDCENGAETALHMLAKSILEKKRHVKVPGVHVLTRRDAPFFREGRRFPETKDAYLSKAMYIEFDRVELEKRVDEFVPDIALYTGGRCLLVEIKVSHGVDDLKLRKIKNSGVSALEVDLSGFQGGITESGLERVLIDSLEYKKWIYNKKAEYYKNAWLGLCDRITPASEPGAPARYAYYASLAGKCPQNRSACMESCYYCKYCIDICYEPQSCVYCCGRNKISSLDQLKAYQSKTWRRYGNI